MEKFYIYSENLGAAARFSAGAAVCPADALAWDWESPEHDDYVLKHGPSFKYGVVRLMSWPDLSGAPVHLRVLVARLCALLSRKPTAGGLIPVVLTAQEAEVHRIMAVLARLHHIKISHAGLTGEVHEEDAPAPVSQPEASVATAQARPRSLIGKLWSRLVG